MSLPDSAPPAGSPAWWDARYAGNNIPWDTGIVPPEVEDVVGGFRPERGWALDLGCGRGTRARYLAQQGFQVVGLDLAVSALADARRLAAKAGLQIHFCAGSVVDLCFLAVQATLALDIGCFHSLLAADRPAYIASLAQHVLPGGLYLLYALYPQLESSDGPPGLAPVEVAGFAPFFNLQWAQHGFDRNRPSAWYLMARTQRPASRAS